MTFEEFESLALNPPRRDEETIFEVIEYGTCPLPERKRCHYPRFDVYNSRIGFAHTLQDAEALTLWIARPYFAYVYPAPPLHNLKDTILKITKICLKIPCVK